MRVSTFSFTPAPEMRSKLSLRDLYKPYFIVRLADDFVLVDFTNMSSVLVDATRFAIGQGEGDQDKNKRFERDLQEFLRPHPRIRGFAFECGKKFKDEHGDIAEVDVSPVIGDCLIWVECKTARWSQGEERGDFREVRKKWDHIAHGKKSWLSQAYKAALQVARGSGFGRMEDCQRI